MVRGMAKGLLDQGCSVEIATTDDDGPSRRVPFDLLPGESITKVFPRRTSFYTIAPSLGRWIRRHIADYDLVHLFALFSYPVIPVSRAARRHHVPYVVSPLGSLNEWGLAQHHPRLKRISLALVERSVLTHARAVHFNSPSEADQAQKVLALGRYVLIPAPVDDFVAPSPQTMARFADRFPAMEGGPVVLFLSRFDSTKGLDQLIPAFADVRSRVPQVHLILAGEGHPSIVSKIDEWIREHGLDNYVLRPGFLNDEDKAAALALTDIVVQPSYSENFGISVAEAMMAGVAVVVTVSSGISDIVQRSSAGLVVQPRRQEIAGALTRLLTDPDMRRGCAQRGRQAAERYFRPREVGAQLLEFYKDVLIPS